MTIQNPNGKLKSCLISQEDINKAKNLRKISEIDNSYYDDPSELKFEKKIMVILEKDPQKEVRKMTPKYSKKIEIEELPVFITKDTELTTLVPLSSLANLKLGSSKNEIWLKLLKYGLYPLSS